MSFLTDGGVKSHRLQERIPLLREGGDSIFLN
jgi:hypothetical protein